jgi:hypothetical protein
MSAHSAEVVGAWPGEWARRVAFPAMSAHSTRVVGDWPGEWTRTVACPAVSAHSTNGTAPYNRSATTPAAAAMQPSTT